jgi:hypothetical protein
MRLVYVLLVLKVKITHLVDSRGHYDNDDQDKNYESESESLGNSSEEI